MGFGTRDASLSSNVNVGSSEDRTLFVLCGGVFLEVNVEMGPASVLREYIKSNY
jgi:hypothetical protein